MPYSYISWNAAVAALASRLQDPNLVYWNQPSELSNCLVESLRLFNALTGWYKQKLAFATQPYRCYYDLTAQDGSPVAYTATDVEVANNVLAALLEPPLPPYGPSWVGTGQFTFAQLKTAFERRLDRFLGDTGCTIAQQTVPGPTPPADLAPLADTVLDVRRAAWIPLPPTTSSSTDPLFADAVVPSGVQDGVNRIFVLPQAPSPPSSLLLELNGITQTQGVNYTIVGAVVTFAVGAFLPYAGNLFAWYRYASSISAPNTGYPLDRQDEWSEQAYVPGAAQSPAQPLSYSVYATGPLAIRTVPPPSDEGELDLLVVQTSAAVALNPLAPVVLGIPDDLSPALKWGVLADLLGSDGPSRDFARAAYCEQRYREFVQIASVYPSVLVADIDNVTCGIGSVFSLDWYMPDWQQTTGQPTFVGTCGRNLVCVGPTPDANGPYGVGLWLVASAPVSANAPVQVARDALEPVLNYAQHIASFKMAGAEFDGTTRLYQNLIAAAKAENGRLEAVSFYRGQMQQFAQQSETDVMRMVS